MLSMSRTTSPSVAQHATLAKVTHKADDSSTPSADLVRIQYGAWLIGASFVLLAVVLGVAASRFTAASDVAAVVGSVATVIGTIVGAFFGVQVGSSGKEAAEAGRAHAERATRMALGKLDPNAADDLLKLM